MKTLFRKFMVKNFVGLSGFYFTWRGQKRCVTWMKVGPRFFIAFLLMIALPALLGSETISLIGAGVWLVAVIAVSYYAKKHPLTIEEANDFEKQGYDHLK